MLLFTRKPPRRSVCNRIMPRRHCEHLVAAPVRRRARRGHGELSESSPMRTVTVSFRSLCAYCVGARFVCARRRGVG